MRSHCATLLVSWPVHEPNIAVCSGARRQPAAKTGSIDKATADTRTLRQCAGDDCGRREQKSCGSICLPHGGVNRGHAERCLLERDETRWRRARSSRDLEPPAPVMFHGSLPEREGASQAERAAFARVPASSNTRPVDLCWDCFCHCLPARVEGSRDGHSMPASGRTAKLVPGQHRSDAAMRSFWKRDAARHQAGHPVSFQRPLKTHSCLRWHLVAR